MGLQLMDFILKMDVDGLLVHVLVVEVLLEV